MLPCSGMLVVCQRLAVALVLRTVLAGAFFRAGAARRGDALVVARAALAGT